MLIGLACQNQIVTGNRAKYFKYNGVCDASNPAKTAMAALLKIYSIACAAPVMADGMLFVNSGYAQFGENPGNVLLAFEVKK